MGLFGFGRKNRKAEAIASQTEDVANEDVEDLEEAKDAESSDTQENHAQEEKRLTGQLPDDVSLTYEGRGTEFGPWDSEEDNAPDYDEYLSLGAFYIPFVQGIQLRLKASRADNTLLGATVTLGHSSLEIEAFAAPKTMGLWDDVREDLLANNPNAKAVAGIFGTEVLLPVKLPNGSVHPTRIVGIDGPRWMLRGIFSGAAADQSNEQETEILNRFFSDIVVERGDAPLAPRDLIPMAPPLTPSERRAAAQSAQATTDENGNEIPQPYDGPLDSDQQVEVKTTLSRGPMFSEVR